MSEVEDLERYKLPDWMHAEIFHNQIVPERLAGPAYQERPVVVFIGGQPGAGKTATTDTIKHALDTRGGAAHICGDFYKPYHPDYARLLAEDDRTAGAYTRLDTRQWHTEAEAYVRERHCHAVVETALADPAGFAETARRFHVSGYRVEVAALAVPAALSRLGLMDRYMRQAQIDGRGRFVARANHDACYHGLIETAARIDREGSADTAFAFRRGNDPVFENHRSPDGKWAGPPQFAEAINAERTRRWSARESMAFCNNLNRVAQQLGPEWRTELVDIAAFAQPLAEPGTPLAAAAAGRAEGAYGVTAEVARLRSVAFPPTVVEPLAIPPRRSPAGERPHPHQRPGSHPELGRE